MSQPGKHSDLQYLQFPFFDGDRDVDVRRYQKHIVYTRAVHTCLGNNPGEKHEIPKGTRALREKAIVDGKWCSNHLCVDCMDRWMAQFKQEVTGVSVCRASGGEA